MAIALATTAQARELRYCGCPEHLPVVYAVDRSDDGREVLILPELDGPARLAPIALRDPRTDQHWLIDVTGAARFMGVMRTCDLIDDHYRPSDHAQYFRPCP